MKIAKLVGKNKKNIFLTSFNIYQTFFLHFAIKNSFLTSIYYAYIYSIIKSKLSLLVQIQFK